MNFSDGADKFLRYIQVSKSDGTYRYNKSKVSVLKKYFCYRSLDRIDRDVIIQFISYLREKNPKISSVSINKYISTLKRIIRYNTDRNVVFDKLSEGKKVIKTIDNNTIEKVMGYLKSRFKYKESVRNYAFFSLLLDTGLRLSEALNLKISDIDFSTKTILVRITKTKNERYVFFTENTQLALQRMLAVHKHKDYMFIIYHNNNPLTVTNIQSICYRIEKALQLEHAIRPHRWRHTFATKYLRQGGDLESLRMILGHSNLKTTQMYLHLDISFLHKEYFKVFK